MREEKGEREITPQDTGYGRDRGERERERERGRMKGEMNLDGSFFPKSAKSGDLTLFLSFPLSQGWIVLPGLTVGQSQQLVSTHDVRAILPDMAFLVGDSESYATLKKTFPLAVLAGPYDPAVSYLTIERPVCQSYSSLFLLTGSRIVLFFSFLFLGVCCFRCLG